MMFGHKFIWQILVFAIMPLQFFSQASGGYIAGSIGAAMPGGNYAEKNIRNATAFATTGPAYSLNFMYKPATYFAGLGVLIRSQFNPVDIHSMEGQEAAANPHTSGWKIQSKPWNVNLFMAGGYSPITFNNLDRFSLNIKYMFGAAYSVMPLLTATFEEYGQTYSATSKGATTASVAYLIGFGMNYNLNTRICVFADVDYFGTKAEFLMSQIYGGAYTGAAPLTHTYSQTISSLTISAGIGFRLK